MPFQPKPNMSIAPTSRRSDLMNMNEEERREFLDKLDNEMFQVFVIFYLII